MIKLCEWTDMPGARYRTDGPFSGEAFREDVLVPGFKRYTITGQPVTVDLDNTQGIARSWIEEAFGGLVRIYGLAAIRGIIPKGTDASYEKEAREDMVAACVGRNDPAHSTAEAVLEVAASGS